MGEIFENKSHKQICAAFVAHVDAGKTTLSEGMLYTSGNIRRLGRVDNQDAFLDTYELERARGITIFSKQAVMHWKDLDITLLDTPGHVDFSAEMERTLQVLDYAILLINGADGVQGHTQTLWRLLERYQIPVFLFVNKMDQISADKPALLAQLGERLSDSCVDFTKQDGEAFYDALAMCSETAMDQYLEQGEVQLSCIQEMVKQRQVFPCFFGSALKMQGVTEFLEGFERYVQVPRYPQEFAAKVFKISRDEQGNRLTYMKITGGSLKVRTILSKKAQMMGQVQASESDHVSGQTQASGSNRGSGQAQKSDGAVMWEEKVTQIRIYSGAKYETVNEASAGTVCAVTGLTQTKPGDGLGLEPDSGMPVLEPVLTYQIILPEGMDAAAMLPKLKQLEEEEPQLHVGWNEQLQEIQAQLMGEVQLEVLTSMIQERFGVLVEFGAGNIVYKETIADRVEGVGHFEPLRHYAEVHLLLEPGEEGSGMQFAAACSEDLLDRNWQRLILTHLKEREHQGVLTGSALTDMRITLVTGRAHLKHTEGGDFRQATYRAVRQGLMQAQSVLLEPYYDFYLELPEAMVGRAMTDLENMHARLGLPAIESGMSVLTGSAPVVTIRGYQKDVTEYTKGLGRLSCTFRGYAPCHNTQEVLERTAYDPQSDLANPSASVFCAHGAGFLVEWYDVKDYMHVESAFVIPKSEETQLLEEAERLKKRAGVCMESIGTEEVDKIIASTYQANKRDKSVPRKNGVRRKTRSYGSSQETSEQINEQQNVQRIGQTDRQLNNQIDGQITDRVNKQSNRSSYDRAAERGAQKGKEQKKQEEYFLVDGYNIIFAWKELKELAKDNIDGARGRLLDIMCNYQALKKCCLIVVFDAYRVVGHQTEYFDYHNIHVVYTKEAETADQYIERFSHDYGRKYHVTVATSDGLEQIIIRGQGCHLVSAVELEEEVWWENNKMKKEFLEKQPRGMNMPFAEAFGKK